MPSRPKSRLPTGLFVKQPVTPLDKRSNVPAKSVMAGGKRLLSGFSVRHSMKMTMFCREQHCDSTSQFVKSIWVDLFFGVEFTSILSLVPVKWGRRLCCLWNDFVFSLMWWDHFDWDQRTKIMVLWSFFKNVICLGQSINECTMKKEVSLA